VVLAVSAHLARMAHSADWIGRSPAIARGYHAEAERWEDRPTG
jgi:hypothetical protein